MRRRFAKLTLLILSNFGIFGQTGRALAQAAAQISRFENLTIADGLSQGMIYDILQDRDGFFWFATKDGLNRYDGYRFEVFTNDPFDPFSIGGNDIHRMFEDSRGNLWLALAGNGIDVLEHSTGRFLHLPGVAFDRHSFNAGCFAETPDGSIWAGTMNGLLRLRWKNEKIESPDLRKTMLVETASMGATPDKSLFASVLALPDGNLLTLIFNDGVYKFNPANSQLTSVLPDVDRSSLVQTAPGKVWMLTPRRTVFIENGQPREVFFNGKRPSPSVGIYADGQGNLIWAHENEQRNSFYLTAPEAEILKNGSISEPKLFFEVKGYSPTAEIDRSGNFWVGTNGYGLRKIHLFRQPFRHFLPGISVRRVFTGSQTLVLPHHSAGFGQMLEVMPDGSARPALFPVDLSVICPFYSKKGTTYLLATDGKNGYFCVGPDFRERHKTETWVSFTFPMAEDGQGNIWLGTGDGQLIRYSPAEKKLTYHALPPPFEGKADVTVLQIDRAQNLWVGTENGIVRVSDFGFQVSDAENGAEAGTNPKSEIRNPKLQIYQTEPSNPKSLRHNHVACFLDDPADPERFLWIGTKGGGLNLLDKKTGKFSHFTTQNSNLPNDVVYGVLPGNASISGASSNTFDLWMSTNRGLSRLTVDAGTGQNPAERTYHFQNFREFDGLQNDEFNTSAFSLAPDGRLFFGGVNGLTVFQPAEIRGRTSEAPICITGLKINNLYVNHRQPGSVLRQPVSLSEEIELRHDQNLVTLEFALLDFANPLENRFRYRLLGIEKDWVEAGTSHSANYAQLRPGKYTFEVQGSIGGGVWNDKSARLEIRVLPPWWATWWAYLLYFLLGGGALFAFYKFRLRQKLEHQEALRLQDLDAFKTRFFTNITHEFRTPLTVILGNADLLKTEIPAAAKPKLTAIRRNGEALLRLINQILDLAKLENRSLPLHLVQGDVAAFVNYVAESFQSFANSKNLVIRVENHSKQAQILMDFDAERLSQILQNLISNALKFTPSGGRIEVKVDAVGDLSTFEKLTNLILTVSDTGAGIPPEDLPYVFDRFFQSGRPPDPLKGEHTSKNKNKTSLEPEDSNVSPGNFVAKNNGKNSTEAAPPFGGWTQEGSGIGLALTKELVGLLGGEISVKSELGRGTTFTVKLPISKTAPLQNVDFQKFETGFQTSTHQSGFSEDPALSSANSSFNIHHSSLKKLLIIEDNPDVVDYLTRCLEKKYALDFAFNGRAGIEKALEIAPEIVVSDVMMPEQDGFEVCDFLKNDERTSHIPIVLLTAKADVESRIAGLRWGADAYLAKPFHPEELDATLENLLTVRQKLQAKYRAVATETPPPVLKTADPENDFLKKLRQIVEENLSNLELDGEMICRKIGMSRSNLHSKLSALTGMPISHFIRTLRLRRAKELLETTTLNVSEVAYEVGFDNPKYFSRLFSEEFGLPPSELKKR